MEFHKKKHDKRFSNDDKVIRAEDFKAARIPNSKILCTCKSGARFVMNKEKFHEYYSSEAPKKEEPKKVPSKPKEPKQVSNKKGD